MQDASHSPDCPSTWPFSTPLSSLSFFGAWLEQAFQEVKPQDPSTFKPLLASWWLTFHCLKHVTWLSPEAAQEGPTQGHSAWPPAFQAATRLQG